MVADAPPESWARSVAESGSAGSRGSELRPAWAADDPLELLPEQPPRLVELVHAHVHGDAPAVGAELLGRWLLVPLHARELADLTELAGPDTVAQRA